MNGNLRTALPNSSQLSPVNGLSRQSIDSFFGGTGKKRGLSTSAVSRLHPQVVNGDLLDWPA
jgi:hypothetical protein